MKKLLICFILGLVSINAHALRVSTFTLLSSTSMAASITSSIQKPDQDTGFSVQAVWTGSPVGDIKIQASNDCVNWSDMTSSDQTVSGAGSFVWNIDVVYFHCFQVVYTRTSGTGNLVLTETNKGP